jgi:hypothetical protein
LFFSLELISVATRSIEHDFRGTGDLNEFSVVGLSLLSPLLLEEEDDKGARGRSSINNTKWNANEKRTTKENTNYSDLLSNMFLFCNYMWYRFDPEI